MQHGVSVTALWLLHGSVYVWAPCEAFQQHVLGWYQTESQAVCSDLSITEWSSALHG